MPTQWNFRIRKRNILHRFNTGRKWRRFALYWRTRTKKRNEEKQFWNRNDLIFHSPISKRSTNTCDSAVAPNRMSVCKLFATHSNPKQKWISNERIDWSMLLSFWFDTLVEERDNKFSRATENRRLFGRTLSLSLHCWFEKLSTWLIITTLFSRSSLIGRPI